MYSSETRWVPVDSETISLIRYAPRGRLLELRFRKSGDVYRYFEVPAEEHAEFMAAESKGTYLNRVFKAKRHRYTVVNRKIK